MLFIILLSLNDEVCVPANHYKITVAPIFVLKIILYIHKHTHMHTRVLVVRYSTIHFAKECLSTNVLCILLNSLNNVSTFAHWLYYMLIENCLKIDNDMMSLAWGTEPLSFCSPLFYAL